MGRKAKPPRAIMRSDDQRWIIVDRGKQIATGLSGDDSKEAAEAAAFQYRVQRHLEATEGPVRPRRLSRVSVDEVLAHYLDGLGTKVVAKDRQAYAVMALLPFWTGKTCADINDKTCDKYVEHRAKQNRKTSTARRELGVLRAAVVRAHANGIIEAAPSVSLPPMGEPSPGWLSRSELARLLWDLRRRKETRHAARFVICMFYSGSRPGTVIKTTWKQRKDGPWVDLRNKIWWRAGAEEQKTKKSRRRHRIPISLMSHLNRWRRIMMEEVQAGRSAGQTYVIEDPNHPGKPASDLRIILTEACERLNITRITPHGLKHTAITNAIKSGMSLTVAADYFSTSVQTIERVYWHQSPYHQQEAAAMMDWAGKPPSSGPSRRNGTQ